MRSDSRLRCRAVSLSRDHKPQVASERKRIRCAGGRISAAGRIDGNLNLSRAFGDFFYKRDSSRPVTQQKIIAEAEVMHQPLTNAERFLVLGCDGVFDRVESRGVVDFLWPRLRSYDSNRGPPLAGVCSAFLDANMTEDPAENFGRGADNMTMLIVHLPAQSQTAASSPGKPACVLQPQPPLFARAPMRAFGGSSATPTPSRRKHLITQPVLSPRRTVDKQRRNLFALSARGDIPIPLV